MATKRGRVLYVPKVVVNEIDDIIREDKVKDKADAFRLMTRYARVGRSAFRLAKLDFTHKKELPPVDIEIPILGNPRRRGKNGR